MQPASLAKVMTLFLVFDALEKGDVELNDEVLISKKAAQKEGSTMYLRGGDNTPLAELIKGIAVVSGNDACVAVAEKISGSEQAFVDRMNQKVEELSLRNTRFQTVDGWPVPEQYTTAYDMAMLSRAYIREHPEALEYHKTKEFSHADIVLHNRNGLIFEDPTVDGLKTGHVEEAGYHLIATAKRDGRRCIAVAMGAGKPELRESETRALLEYGFNSYTTVTLFHAGDILSHLSVSKGKNTSVGVHSAEDGVITLPVSQRDMLSYEIVSPPRVEAPIELNQQLGHVAVSCRNEVLKTIPLLASGDVPVAGRKMQAMQFVKALLAGPGSLVLILFVLLGLLGVQTLYIIRLRRRLKRESTAEAELVKERLDSILKSK